MFDLVECVETKPEGDVEYTVSVVPTSWIRNGHCYWPHYSAGKTSKSVKCADAPDFDAWKFYPARSLGTFGNYANINRYTCI